MAGIGVLQSRIINVQIVVSEALNNIIEHGFSGENSGTINIAIKVFDNKIVVELMDDGEIFTPPSTSEAPLIGQADLKDLPEGGFGWFLIKEITSSFDFQRHSHTNKLILNFQQKI